MNDRNVNPPPPLKKKSHICIILIPFFTFDNIYALLQALDIICLRPKIKSHLQLPPLLALCSYQKKIIYAMYYKHRGLHLQRTENKACI